MNRMPIHFNVDNLEETSSRVQWDLVDSCVDSSDWSRICCMR